MQFNSINFLIFFPFVALCYYIIPQKFKNIFLVIASYFFYMSWNVKYGILLLICTVFSHFIALAIERYKSKKAIMITGIIVSASILVYYKYFNFILKNINTLFVKIGIALSIPKFDIIMPIGISFFTFQIIAYIVDVYKGKEKAEKNFIRYALFVSFFPKISQGPIERASDFMHQLYDKHRFDIENIKKGILLMLWGYFKKLVIADRAAIFVSDIFDHYVHYSGAYILVATLFFTIQIYCDFSGYTDIALGAARIMGFRLKQNFKNPYFASSIADFWRRWHISLTSWLRDYIYIPLGGNRCGDLRRDFNIMITFLISGLWHGASWSYIFWGGLNGVYQIIGRHTAGMKEKIYKLLHINTKCESFRLLKIFVTFMLVNISWLFFRAPGLQDGFWMVKQIFTKFDAASLISYKQYTFGIDFKDIAVMIIAIIILLMVETLSEKHDVYAIFERQNMLAKWVAVYVLFFAVIIFGVYGASYSASAFVYFQY